jgi:hypothetical protein
MQYFIVQDIAVTSLLPTQTEHNIALYPKICTNSTVTRKCGKLWRIHDLISPPLYNPVWKDHRSHSFSDGYVPNLLKIFFSEAIKFWRRTVLRWFLRLTASYCFKISRADCNKLLISFWIRVEQISVKLLIITLQQISKFNANVLDYIKRRGKYFSR